MKSIYVLLRTILGVIYLVYGINTVVGVLPPYEFPTVRANNFLLLLESSGYLIGMTAWFAGISGLSLILNFAVPFFLILFLPFVINYFLFQYYMGGELFFTPEVIAGITILLLHLIIGLGYGKSLVNLFKQR